MFQIWIGWITNIFKLSIYLGINLGGVYLLYRLIKYFIRYHAECQSDFAEQREQKQHNQRKMENINKELDEIEASLNAVQDEKVTPIWELPRKD